MPDAIPLEVLFAKKPYLRAYFTSADDDIRFETARSRERIVVYRGRSLSSKYRPGEEADRLLATVRARLRPRRILFVSGLGNPIVLDRILALHSPGQICIAVDHRSDLVRFLARNDPAMHDFLARPGCHLFSPDLLESLWSYLAGLPIEGFRGITMIRHPGSLADAPEFYRDTETRVQGFLKSGLSDLLTRFEFESLWFRNTLLNLRYLPESRVDARDSSLIPSPQLLSYWHNAWKDRPALLVGAGPSLRRSLPLIRSLADRCLILACDTALKPLLRAGIRPHGVHILDAQPHTLLHLRGEDLSGIVLFADLVVHPHLAERLAGAKWIFSTTSKYYYDAAGSPVRLQTPGAAMAGAVAGEIGALQSGGSVATSAFDLLRFLGASPILLAGTDLAWTWRQLHCVGTHHYEKWMGTQHRLCPLEHTNETLLRRRVCSPVAALEPLDADKPDPERPGQPFHTVSGDHALDLYRRWFEESIAGLPDLPVWNLTAAGAKIHGALRPASLTHADKTEVWKTILAGDSGAGAGCVPGELFAKARPLNEVPSSLLQSFARAARHASESLSTGKEGLREFDALLVEFPDAAALRRKADSYIRRNASRLDEERREAIVRQYGGRELKKMLRWFEGRI